MIIIIRTINILDTLNSPYRVQRVCVLFAFENEIKLDSKLVARLYLWSLYWILVLAPAHSKHHIRIVQTYTNVSHLISLSFGVCFIESDNLENISKKSSLVDRNKKKSYQI